MPLQHEREMCARNRRIAQTLDDIALEILGARDLVWAGWLASQHLDGNDAAALGELLDTVAKRLADIAEKTGRTSQGEGTTDAA